MWLMSRHAYIEVPRLKQQSVSKSEKGENLSWESFYFTSPVFKWFIST